MSIKKNRIFVVISAVLVVVITSLIFHYTQNYYRNSALGKRYFNKGYYSKALPYLQAAYKSKPASFEVGQYLVWAYDRLGRKNEALGILEALSQTYPEDFGARRLLADLHYGVGDYTEAEKHYRHALVIKSNLTVQRKLAEVLAWQKKYNQSATILERLHNKNPRNYKITEFLADVYSWNGQYDKAIELYSKLLSSKNADKNIIMKLADVLRYAGRDEQAIELYDKYIQKIE